MVHFYSALDTSSYVFTTNRTKDGKRPSVNSTVRYLWELLGFHFTPHDLRRTAVTHMARIGVPAEIRKRIVNHVTGGVHQIYDRYDYEEEKRLGLEKWSKYLRCMQSELRAVT